jgi:integrase
MWRGTLKHVLPSRAQVRRLKPVQHHAALPWQDVPAFMADLRTRDALAARALEFTILCTTRTAETLGAEWSEIRDDLWVIPASRMKTAREFRIPLSRQAAAILADLPQLGEHVFPVSGPAGLSQICPC